MGKEVKILERQDIHLLVVDDDDRIRDLLRQYLSAQGYRVSTAANADAARRLMDTLAFDLIVLDIMMPGEDGIQFTQSLRQENDVPIILLTARGETQDRITGLKAGGDDYLSKPFEPEELVLRIDSIFKRLGSKVRQNIVQFGPWQFDIERQVLTKSGHHMRLTSGEEALLTLLAKRPDTPVSRHALSEQISAGSERAVDVQITRLRRKLEEVPAEPTYLLTVRGLGYRLLTDAI